MNFLKLPLICLFVALGNILLAQLSPQEVSIPMRDGKSLSAHLYLPNSSGTFPTILIQTPYNKNNYKTTGLPLGVRQNIATSNYAFVIVDWRCFYGSTSACVANVDRGNDGYDAVEWIAAQTWSDGKIGTWGPSALGNIQFNTAVKQPPHLVCAVPEVCSPQTFYNDYYPGGVLISGRIQSLNLLYGGAFNIVIDNPYYNYIWQYVENTTLSLNDVNVPMLLVAGWYDHNTAVDIPLLQNLRQVSGAAVRDKHKILIGPWVHGGTSQAYVGSSNQGELFYPDAEFVNHAYENAFFDFYLRGIDNKWESDTAIFNYYQMNEQKWNHSATWPPVQTTTKILYFSGDNTLDSNVGGDDALSYTYYPNDPSPSTGGKTLTPGLSQGPLDQRTAVESRGDVQLFTSGALDEDLVIKGGIKANLFVSSNRLDTDFMARLTQVYPDGRSMLLGETVLRMRYRNGNTIADTAFMKQGEVYEIDLQFDPLEVTIPKGHKLRVIVSSSNYPHFNRNMNTGGEMYPNTNPDTLVNPLIADNSIWVGNSYPSKIEFEVVESSVGIKEIDTAQALQFHPNPSNGTIHLSNITTKYKLEVHDLSGRLVYSETDRSSTTINLDFLSSGVYSIQLTTSTHYYTAKLLID